MIQYEIFTLEADGLSKNENIDTLFGYPSAVRKTDRYRGTDDEPLIKKYDEDLWAAIVDTKLTDACSGMTPSERGNYYGDQDLKNETYLRDNNWYPPT